MNIIGQAIELISLKGVNLSITITDDPIMLPPKLQKEVDQHWQGMIAERPNLFNGTAFSVASIDRTPAKIAVTMAQTSFAHNVYCERHDAGDYAFRVLHSATLVVTSDNQIVLGEMGPHTARAGAICCSGGGIDSDDVRDNTIDLTGNTVRELREELGIDVNDPTQVASFAPYYLKTGGPQGKMTAVYRADLAISADAFQKRYDAFVAELTDKGETPEFSRLHIVHNTPEQIATFISEHPTLDEYVPPVLRIISESKQ